MEMEFVILMELVVVILRIVDQVAVYLLHHVQESIIAVPMEFVLEPTCVVVVQDGMEWIVPHLLAHQ
jgi:hypothetical protein